MKKYFKKQTLISQNRKSTQSRIFVTNEFSNRILDIIHNNLRLTNSQISKIYGCVSRQLVNKMVTNISQQLQQYICNVFTSATQIQLKTFPDLISYVKIINSNSYSQKLLNQKQEIEKNNIQTQTEDLFIASQSIPASTYCQSHKITQTDNKFFRTKSILIRQKQMVKTQISQDEKTIQLKSLKMNCFVRDERINSTHKRRYSSKMAQRCDSLSIKQSIDQLNQKKYKIVSPYYPVSKGNRAKLYYKNFKKQNIGQSEVELI